MSLPSVGKIVIASAIIVLGRTTFLTNSGNERFGDFAISQFGTLAMCSGIFFILVHTSATKGGSRLCFHPGLFVSVNMTSQKVVDGFGQNLVDRLGV